MSSLKTVWTKKYSVMHEGKVILKTFDRTEAYAKAKLCGGKVVIFHVTVGEGVGVDRRQYN